LHKSGLHQICQGAESGSRKVWKAMNKDFQDFPTIYESAARCLAAGIRPSFNIIFAFPGEGAKERRETINFVMDVCRKLPGAEFWTNIFTPYPGIPIWPQLRELGVVEPMTLEDWMTMPLGANFLPWLKGRELGGTV